MSVRIALRTGRTKPPIIEYSNDNTCWRVWTAYNGALDAGTFVELGDDGRTRWVTLNPDGSETYFYS